MLGLSNAIKPVSTDEQYLELVDKAFCKEEVEDEDRVVYNLSDEEVYRTEKGSGGSESISITVILSKDGWTEYYPIIQEVNVPGILAESNGVCGISISASEEQYEKAAGANLRLVGQEENKIIVEALGDIPDIDIPIDVVIV